MKAASIARTLNKIANCKYGYSLGFTRYMHLPKKVALAMGLAHVVLTGNTNSAKAVNDFLASLTDSEFKTWMAAQ